ncbi:MAG TPA: hypothetical protein VK032_06625, partial [Burkholderiaceae bacterium]|nr:hypothetical protein [Burkholderiaceae bacterium]
GFCGVLIEALADRSNHERYSPQLRARVVKILSTMLGECLPAVSHESQNAIATMMLMAFDGYALNYHLRDGQTAHNNEINALCQMILHTHHTSISQ